MSSSPSNPRHIVAVDTGGTFTDMITADGRRLKLPSTPADPSQAITSGLAELQAGSKLAWAEVRHGTTVATNAILERRGVPVVLVTTHGFEDVLRLRRQSRPDLYALHPVVPAPLVSREHTLGIRGRLQADGDELAPLEDLQAWHGRHGATLQHAKAIAVCLLHAYRNPLHEQQLGRYLRQCYDVPVVLSHELVPLDREFERTSTVAVNAYVGPIMEAYLAALQSRIHPARLWVMGSAGGLLSADSAACDAVHTVLSGPAGGVRGAFAAGQRVGRTALLTFDMGGTSTDVCVVQGELQADDEGFLAEHPLRIPLLPIETVGAGGGSIAYVDEGGALRVGPRSAGATPGPAAYGKAGPDADATVTDANVVLGRLPSLLGGAMPAHDDLARQAVERLAQRLSASVEDTAHAIVRVVEANMARACKRVSMERGIDPRQLTLVAFGGAAGLHACALASALGCKDVLFPKEPGVLSAEGILSAPVEATAAASIFLSQDQWTGSTVQGRLQQVMQEASAQLQSEGAETAARVQVLLDCRYVGQTFSLAVRLEDVLACAALQPSVDLSQHADALPPALRRAFDQAHMQRYGYRLADDRLVEWVAVRAFAKADGEKAVTSMPAVEASWQGPQVISAYSATLWLPQGWQAQRYTSGDIVCQCAEGSTALQSPQTPSHEPLELEVHRQQLAAIAEEMGAALMRASFSANIKERRDFSCALFDGTGRMLVQAAHIPVHLGSQPMSVAAAIAKVPMQPGITVMLNDPYDGGTHLPDVTLVKPVYPNGGSTPLFYVANRAHHADVGGISPGSMPSTTRPDGTKQGITIDDEGFRCGPTVLTNDLREQFASASRTPGERFGDLRAQEAANTVGQQRLLELAESVGIARVNGLNDALLDYTERRMRHIIGTLADGCYIFDDHLDDDGLGDAPVPLRVVLTIDKDQACVDFRQCPDAVPSGMNAVRAITVSAVFYAFRVLGGETLPSNDGLMRPIQILTRKGSLLDAEPPAAVSAGNVETSQRIVDLVLGALAQAAPDKIPAASCGSMNNVLFGGQRQSGVAFVHYETLAGGAGGGPEGLGAPAIHTHMTNTLNTPVEALEREFPVRIVKYTMREPQANGRFPGGSGIIRAYEFLQSTTVTLMTERRRTAPYGLQGGQAGALGHNRLLRQDGTVQELPGKITLQVMPGDVVEVCTPGGAGFGS